MKFIASIVSILYLFLIPFNPKAQPNNIPETRRAPIAGELMDMTLQEDRYGVWPTEKMTPGGAPWWFSKKLLQALYTSKGLWDGGVHTDGLLVLYKGKMIYENYADGWDQEKPHAMHSVTKSVVSALVGIAIGEGHIGSIQDKVIDYLDDAVIPAGQESKNDMTIEHLLTMTSGILCETEEEWDGFFESQTDSALYAFLLPQKKAPGKKYMYDNVAPSILLGIIERAAKRDALDYAQEKLFGPLGMTSVEWETAADGLPFGGFGISMTPRDMARFGYLYLNYGRWEDTQIIPGDYVARSRSRSINPSGYGYMFWNNEAFPLSFTNAYEADGAYGQFISIYPFADMVVVRTGHE